MPTVKVHPLAEILSRKLLGIESVPKEEQTKMIQRAILAGVNYHTEKLSLLQEAFIICARDHKCDTSWTDAIAVGFDDIVELALPIMSDNNLPNWMFLTSRDVLSTQALRAQCHWIVNPKESCMMSDDGVDWRENIYLGFSGDKEYPFHGLHCKKQYIKPLLSTK